MKNKCTSEVTHTNVKIEENKRKAIFRNPNQKIYKITQIDGCLIRKGIRTDYAVSEEESATVFVELKGSNVSHACDQLIATIKHDAIQPIKKGKIGFLVICSKYPRFDTFVAKAKQFCAKQYKAGFHVVCDKGEFDIHRVTEINGPY